MYLIMYLQNPLEKSVLKLETLKTHMNHIIGTPQTKHR